MIDPLKENELKGEEQTPQYLQQKKAYYAGEWKDNQPHGKGSVYY